MVKFKSRAYWATLIALAASFLFQSLRADNWTEWRGSNGDGFVRGSGYPLEWSADKNILWKTKLPAPGNSSPVVYDDRIFLTCANDDGTRRSLFCFDRGSGGILWERSIDYLADDPTHATNPWCAPTPATDGDAVYVWNGSAGATAYDFNGKQLWHRDLGEFIHQWGHGSSPRIYKDFVIIFGSPGPRVLLTALDKLTGETVWEKSFDNITSEPEALYGSFVTPFLWENGPRDELLIPLPGYLGSFNPASGKELWRCDGLGKLTYSDAILSDELILAFSGFKGPSISIAMRKPNPAETGNLTNSHRLWINETAIQRVGTGVVVGDRFYLCGRKGFLQCGDIHTGEIVWTENLRTQAWSSIIFENGLLYLTDQESETIIFEPADTFNLVARNPMNVKEQTNSTLAFSDGQLFFRTHNALYAIEENRN